MKRETSSHYARIVEQAVRSIAGRLDEALDTGTLARKAGMSPLHFHRVFRGWVGETPLELHRRLRLERAAWSLGDSDAPVTRIAFETGYETHESFTRAFSSAFGISPTELRARERDRRSCGMSSAARLASPSGVHFEHGRVLTESFHHEEINMSDVVIEQLEEKCVLAVSHRGAYNTIGGAFARLDAIARPAGLMGSTPPEMVAIYYDDPESTPASELRAHAGIVVPKDTGAPSPLEHVTIPAGRYAKAIHRGPYASLGDAWARLMGGVVVQSGEQLGSGPMYERYVNTPMDAAPADLVTELYVSLAERAEP